MNITSTVESAVGLNINWKYSECHEIADILSDRNLSNYFNAKFYNIPLSLRCKGKWNLLREDGIQISQSFLLILPQSLLNHHLTESRLASRRFRF